MWMHDVINTANSYICIMTVDKCLGHVKTKHLSNSLVKCTTSYRDSCIWGMSLWSHTCGVWVGVCIDGCTLSITGINANCTDTDTEQLNILHCIHMSCLLYIIMYICYSWSQLNIVSFALCTCWVKDSPLFVVFLGTTRKNGMHGGE